MTLKSALLCFFSSFCAAASAQTVTPSGARPADPFLGVVTYRLWEVDAPGARGTADADVPTLTMFRVHAGTGNGTAVVVAPGGAYRGLAANLEGQAPPVGRALEQLVGELDPGGPAPVLGGDDALRQLLETGW